MKQHLINMLTHALAAAVLLCAAMTVASLPTVAANSAPRPVISDCATTPQKSAMNAAPVAVKNGKPVCLHADI